MFKTPPTLCAAALTLGLAGAAGAQEADPDTVVATVNGTDITLGHMIVATQQLNERESGLPDAVLFEGLLERLIQQYAIAGTAGEPSKATELRLDNERNALIASAVVDRLAGEIEVSDEEVQAAYDAEYADFEPNPEYNASHILVETEEAAQQIIAELEGGADFAELAQTRSTGPSGPNGGRLGWFGAGQMVPSFEEAVAALEPGEISDPVQTQFGWHVIKLDDKRLPGVPSLEDTRGDLQNQVFRDKLLARIGERVAEAEVERPDTSGIDPASLRNTEILAE